jgi:hypothetical protein
MHRSLRRFATDWGIAMFFSHIRPTAIASLVLLFALAISPHAQAATVNWATWSFPQTTGLTTGLATGATSDVGVTYSGDVAYSTQIPGFYWLYTSTFSGGTVGDAPTNNTEVTLTGGPGTATTTITFSHKVHDPVLAIASLGNGGVTAQFDFAGSETFAIEAGGPSYNFGGTSIYLCGGDVCGAEGSGVIQFLGNYNSISWTNPVYENYYLVTVGDEGLATGIPETSTWAMMLLGFAGLGFAGYRQAKVTALSAA